MNWSHSKLKCIIADPMAYYLKYIQGISPKRGRAALSIGSAVHWGLEHNTEDLEPYYKEGNFKQINDWSKEKIMAESMLHGYFKEKEDLYNKILTDPLTGDKLTLLEESHELFLNAKLPTFQHLDIPYHEFIGIVDLLLLTDKGFIVLDYKTSSMEPNWDDYLDQIYRYIILLNNVFPDVPVVKVGILNLRKASIRQKQNENDVQYLLRLKNEYDLRSFEYIQYHEYPRETINEGHLNIYKKNLSKMCDMGYFIDKNKLFYINYAEAINKYGKTDYYDIYYNTKDAYLLYQIKDFVWSEEDEEFKEMRDCLPIDLESINDPNVLNKYSIFKQEKEATRNDFLDEKFFIEYLRNKYTIDETLLKTYMLTYNEELKQKI